MDMDKQGNTDLKTIEISGSLDTEFTAEDLLHMSLPFGYVVSVQKIVKSGLACGMVTYSHAADAALAIVGLNGTRGFLVGLLKPREVRGVQPRCLLQDRFSDTPPQGLPSPLDMLHPPAYSQSVCLRIHNLPKHIDQRFQVLSLLPASATNVKVQKKRALVRLPDITTALWLMEILNDLYTGPERLRVSLADPELGAYRATRTQRRRLNGWRRGLL